MAKNTTEFEAAKDLSDESFIKELLAFLKNNKKWWLAPIFIVFGLLTILSILSSSAAAPFIYSLF